MSVARGSGLTVQTSDARSLLVEITGATSGTPVFLLHGTPGSRCGPKPRGSVLYRLGVQLISYDRPGYGGSSRHRGRTVADAAADVLAIADQLGIETFAVVGRSGGGPHALACAALLGRRISCTAVLVSMAPADAEGLDWFLGMADDNVREYTTADRDETEFIRQISARASVVSREPRVLLQLLYDEMAGPDRRVFTDVAIRRILANAYTEALRTGPYGWIDDVLALRRPWGFPLSDIHGPVLLWHGADDNFSPPSHTRWLASRIPHAEIHVEPGAAHFGAVEILPDLLSWMVERTTGLAGMRVAPVEPHVTARHPVADRAID